jgi:Uma2 family endonuclease
MMGVMEPRVPQNSQRMTEQQYLRLEEAAKDKHEFRDGMIVDMAGATVPHVRIASNVLIQLGIRLQGRPCAPYGSDLRVRIDESGNYYYPDVSVICGSPEFAHPPQRTTATNPRIVIEVTSASTESDDRGRKFNDYRRLASLEEYFLISQDRPSVEAFYRQPDRVWAIGPTIVTMTAAATFRSLGIEIPLADIYGGIEMPPLEQPEAKLV